MSSPAYYLADLPAETVLNPVLVQEACLALKRNCRQNLAPRSTGSLIRTLATVGEECRNPDSPIRKRFLSVPFEQSGFSPAVLSRGLEPFFESLTIESLTHLVRQDLGHEKRLDELCASTHEDRMARAATATGPELIAHYAAGNLPVSSMQSLVLGVLSRSAQFLKCASGSSALPCLFAHAIHELDPKLGACIEVAEWKGGREELDQPLIQDADCIIASGSNESLSAIRAKVPVTKRFIGYGHRVSFAYITREMLNKFNLPKLTSRAAEDVTVWNQLGCLSPHVIYVEEEGAISVENFAEALAQELTRREAEEPRGNIPTADAAAITNRRHLYQIRAAATPGTRIWNSPESTAWTVVLESDSRFQTSCLNRFIYVKGISNLQEALEGADSLRGQVSTVGIAATEGRDAELATQLARWGVTRICPLGKMQKPPIFWRHDGRPTLNEIVTWTDWEQE